MEVYLERIGQLLPVLGTELLTPITPDIAETKSQVIFTCSMKGAHARGMRSPNGFVVFNGSTAVLRERESAKTQGPWILALRGKLIAEGALREESGFLAFTRDVEFASPSAAAGVVYGGTAPGPVAWQDSTGKTLKEIEEEG